MRAVISRVSRARVLVDGEVVGEIGRGLLVLVGVARGDGMAEVERLADRIVHLRVFDGEDGRMDRSVAEVGGAVLLVSQFTLLGDTRRGRRPGFDAAAPAEEARPVFEAVVREVGRVLPVATGRFGARMQVESVGDGPVTLLWDSRRGCRGGIGRHPDVPFLPSRR